MNPDSAGVVFAFSEVITIIPLAHARKRILKETENFTVPGLDPAVPA
jgi:hypothetical protein